MRFVKSSPASASNTFSGTSHNIAAVCINRCSTSAACVICRRPFLCVYANARCEDVRRLGARDAEIGPSPSEGQDVKIIKAKTTRRTILAARAAPTPTRAAATYWCSVARGSRQATCGLRVTVRISFIADRGRRGSNRTARAALERLISFVNQIDVEFLHSCERCVRPPFARESKITHDSLYAFGRCFSIWDGRFAVYGCPYNWGDAHCRTYRRGFCTRVNAGFRGDCRQCRRRQSNGARHATRRCKACTVARARRAEARTHRNQPGRQHPNRLQ